MNITKEQWINIARAFLVFVLAVAMILGYDIGVVQPREAALRFGGMAASQGVTRFTSDVWLQNSAMRIDKTLAVTGASTMSGGMTGDVTGNVTGNIAGTTGAFTTVAAGVGSASAPSFFVTGDTNSGLYQVAANDIGISADGTLRFDVSSTAATAAVPVAVTAGTAGAPSIYVTGDTNTGLYQVAADNLGVATGGTLRFDVSSTAATAAVPVAVTAGTAGAPALYVTGDTNTGLYQVAADNLGVATGGTLRFDVSSTAATAAVPIVVPLGTAAAPALYMTGDSNSGLYQVAANDVGISADGTLRFDVSATAATSAVPVIVPVGSAAAPAIAFTGDTNTGLYNVGANDLGISTNGVLAMDVSATAATFALPVYLPAGAVGTPAMTFAADTDSGMYNIGANNIGFATNGVLAADISASAVTFALPVTSAGDWTFGIGNASAAIAAATQAEGVNGNAVTLTGGQAGVAATGAAGKNGGAVTITGGLGTDKEGAGTPSGNGGDVVLVGGAKGGSTGGNVTGVVRVGTPTVASVKTVDLLAVAGGLEVDGAALFDGNVSLSAGTLTGPAEGSVVYNLMVDVTAAEINAGHTLITVPAARQFRLVDARATAYGATCTTSTSVYLKGGSNTLATYTVANLVQSTLLNLNSTGVAVAADGAAFTAQTAGDDVTVISNSADTAGCTGVRFVISYALD